MDRLLQSWWSAGPSLAGWHFQRFPFPANSQTLLLYSIGGYSSSRVYVSLGGTNRKKNAFLTATALPTYASSSLFHRTLMNVFSTGLFSSSFSYWTSSSYRQAPPEQSLLVGGVEYFLYCLLIHFPGTMMLIIVLWFGISAPLSAVGSYFGSKHGVWVLKWFQSSLMPW